jgi:hypothetical protein
MERAEAKMINDTTMELKSAHVSMLSHPKEVAAFITLPLEPYLLVKNKNHCHEKNNIHYRNQYGFW